MKRRQIISIILSGLLSVLFVKLELASTDNVNILLAVTIFVFGTLFLNKLSYYIEKNSLENKSVSDIIFLAVFFIVLFIPMSHIDTNDVSHFDYRELPPFPKLIENNSLNRNFGSQYDSWFTDRFFTRRQIVQTRNDLFSYITVSGRAPKYYQNRNNNFLYNNTEARNINIKRAAAGLKSLEKFNEFCEENGIKLYIIIVPSKISVYNIPYIKNNDKEFYDIVKKEREEKNLNIIFPSEELKREAVGEYVFYKTEHHWTDTGAYIGYREIMKLIKKDFPQAETLGKDDFNFFSAKKIRSDFKRTYNTYGYTCSAHNVPQNICKDYSTTYYKYAKHKNFDKLVTKMIIAPRKLNKYYYYPEGADLSVILLGTSMNENLSEYVPFTFKNVYRLRTNNVPNIPEEDSLKIMKYHKDDILNYRPDIIIFCLTLLNLYHLDKLFDYD